MPSGEGYSQKNWVGGAARVPKLLPYLWPKSAIFSTLFMICQSSFFSKKHTQFKTRVQKPHPIYDQNGWKP